VPVGVHDDAFCGHGQRAFAHFPDQYPERLIGIFGRKQLHASPIRDDQRVHLAAAHLAQGRIGLCQPGAQLRVFSAELLEACGRVRHHSFLRKSSPTSTRPVSDMSPMTRRKGSGNFLMSVGTATIWSPCASCGCWYRSITSSS